MILTEITQVDIVGLLGGGTLGSIITMVVQKVLTSKRDNIDIMKDQITMFSELLDKAETVIDKLQKTACYKEPCKSRINGEGE